MFVSATQLNSNSTGLSFVIPSISFDNGLVEISALTTLISSSAAASLALGNRGPSGLAWAATSAFGIIAVVKACLSAAVPGWLCETIGVRSSISDSAVGLPLDLGFNSHSSKRVRKTLDRPIAIQCRGDLSFELNNSKSRNSIGNDIHAYDFSTFAMINTAPGTEPGEPTRIFSYACYPFQRKHEKRIQIGTICFSFLKLTESYFLWRNNADMLAIITTIPWFHFLLFAIVAETTSLKHASHPEMTPGSIDILAGVLPAVKQTGGSRKIIIGAVQNPRHTLFWTIMWGIGAIICTVTTLLTYLLLGNLSKDVILIWAEFQALWMVIRLLVYHLIPPEDPLENRQLAGHRLDSSLSHNTKMRVMRLTVALSKYQTYNHPRGDYSYLHDSFEALEIPSMISRHAFEYPISDNRVADIRITVKAVIGDTTLSSASWIVGSKLTPMQLYDSCVVVFVMNQEFPNPKTHNPTIFSHLLAVPAVRVLAGPAVHQANLDIEKNSHTNQFAPKGTSNLGIGISWLYWIPLDSGDWAFLGTQEGSLDICGPQMGKVMSSEDVTSQLSAGIFSIGLSSVVDVMGILEVSRQCFKDLQQIFRLE